MRVPGAASATSVGVDVEAAAAVDPAAHETGPPFCGAAQAGFTLVAALKGWTSQQSSAIWKRFPCASKAPPAAAVSPTLMGNTYALAAAAAAEGEKLTGGASCEYCAVARGAVEAPVRSHATEATVAGDDTVSVPPLASAVPVEVGGSVRICVSESTFAARSRRTNLIKNESKQTNKRKRCKQRKNHSHEPAVHAVPAALQAGVEPSIVAQMTPAPALESATASGNAATGPGAGDAEGAASAV